MPYFNDTLNVLSCTPEVVEFPFPHGISSSCLSNEIYNELAASRPPWQAIAHDYIDKNNKRVDICAFALLQSKTLASIWSDFIAYHVSHNFYGQILNKFEKYFIEFYPRLKGMRDYKTAIRHSGEEADIYLDCQLSINTPVKDKSTVNNPHVDNPKELWAGLLYMKEDGDNAGGDLVLHKCIRAPKFNNKREADSEFIRPHKTIPYAANSFVSFINSPISIHSVTEREVTDQPRLMVNFVLEMKEPLFTL